MRSLFAAGYLALLILPALAGWPAERVLALGRGLVRGAGVGDGWFWVDAARGASIAALGVLIPIFALSEWAAASLTWVEIPDHRRGNRRLCPFAQLHPAARPSNSLRR